MKLVVSFALVTVLVTGCATAPAVNPPDVQFVDHPSLNTEATAEIGETLVAKGKLYVFDGLELLERITDNGFAREYIVEPHAMRLERIDPQGNQYFAPSYDAYYVNDKTFGVRARPTNPYLIRKPDGTLELQGYYDLTTAGKISPAAPRYKAGKIMDRKQPNFRQELIYSGRLGSQIKLTYREFSDDFIRPGFTQEAQYDLSTDQTVGFKGVRIQILEANNTRLRYKVLRSFPDQP